MNLQNNNVNEELIQIVSFMLGKDEFGIDIIKVFEIIRVVAMTSVPNTPKFVEGIVNLRGNVVPIIDLREKLGMEKKGYSTDTRIIVTQIKDFSIGFIVDSVKEVLRISKNITQPPPDLFSGSNSEYINSIGKLDDRILILIDLEKVLSNSETEAILEVA